MAEAKNKAGDAAKPAVKRTSPGEFFRQVRQEMRKITWPSRSETQTTSIFVAVFTLIMALFFLAVDWSFGLFVRWLVSLIS
jgi:preprotein translocase subunit SecE